VTMLYTDEGVDQYVTYPLNNTNGYDVLSSAVFDNFTRPTNTIKTIVPTADK